MNAWETSLWYLTMLATTLVLLRLSWTGLAKIYRYLFAYLSCDLAQSLVAAALKSDKWWIAVVYMVGQTLKLALAVFVVLELYSLALEKQPALAQFGRQTVGYVLGVAALIALAGLLLDASSSGGKSWILYRFRSFERTMDLCLAIFLVLIGVLMTWFPVRLRRNVVIYCVGFGVYFLARASSLLISNLLPGYTRTVSACVLGISLGCLLFWFFALRREGEETMTVIGHRWDLSATDRLLSQLDSINASLLRLRR